MDYNVNVTSVHVPIYLWASNSSIAVKKDKRITPECDRVFLDEVCTLIKENLNDPEFGKEEIAKKLHISVSQLFRRIKSITEKSVSTFIRGIRLSFAIKMLQNSHLTISEIAFKTGFNDPSYFTRMFVKEFGITPGKVRDNGRKQT